VFAGHAATRYYRRPRSVKVGDFTIDIEEGSNAGCRYNIGITNGAHTHAQLQTAKPDFIIDNLMALLPIIEK
jgi:phosphoglycolate phosphatase-like HAD superfamily hydrolase